MGRGASIKQESTWSRRSRFLYVKYREEATNVEANLKPDLQALRLGRCLGAGRGYILLSLRGRLACLV